MALAGRERPAPTGARQPNLRNKHKAELVISWKNPTGDSRARSTQVWPNKYVCSKVAGRRRRRLGPRRDPGWRHRSRAAGAGPLAWRHENHLMCRIFWAWAAEPGESGVPVAAAFWREPRRRSHRKRTRQRANFRRWERLGAGTGGVFMRLPRRKHPPATAENGISRPG